MTKYIALTAVIILICGCDGNKPKYTEEELAQLPQPQRTGLPRPSGGFALAVGNDAVTAEEVIAPLRENLTPLAQSRNFDDFAQQAGPWVSQSLMNKISEILLYQKARNQAPDDIDERLDKAVEAETRKFIMGFEGNYARAEEFLRERYGMDWKSFRQYQKRMILSTSYLHGMIPEESPVTYSDMMEKYNQQKDKYSVDATITIRVIDIIKTRVETADPNISKDGQALSLANELVHRINSGEDFAELAKQYSHGYRANLGGLWPAVKPDSLAEPYDILADKAMNMNIGEIAGPIDSGDSIFIVKLEDKQTEATIPFEKVQKEIAQEIRMDRKNAAFNNAMNKIFQEASITGIDEFVIFCLERLYTEANLGSL